MAKQIQVTVDKKRVSVAPGASVELGVNVQNLSTLIDQVAVKVEGIDSAWVQVIPPKLPVFGQGTAAARVIISPPLSPAQSVAGVYALRITGESQESKGEEGEAQAELEIQTVGDFDLALTRAGATSGLQASYPIQVHNASNATLQLTCAASDADDALWYKFDPFQVAVPPGGTSSTVLTVKAKRAATEQRVIAFTVTAQAQFQVKGSPPTQAPDHQVTGQYTQLAPPKKAPPPRLSISVDPPTVQTVAQSEYQVRLGNTGYMPVNVHLEAADGSKALAFQFENAQPTLQPQSNGTLKLIVRPLVPESSSAIRSLANSLTQARHPGPRSTIFHVTAFPVDSEAQPVTAEGTFTRVRKPFPWLIVASGAVGLCVIATIATTVIIQYFHLMR